MLPKITETPAFTDKGISRKVIAVIEKAADASKDKTCHGGYLYVLCLSTRLLDQAQCSQFGRISSEEMSTLYRALSEERCRRLADHHQHRTSLESADPKRGCHEGAVRCRNGTIIGFAGRNRPMEDEAIALAVAVSLGSMSKVEARKLAQFSENSFFWHLRAQKPKKKKKPKKGKKK